jgi:hypothetical protein
MEEAGFSSRRKKNVRAADLKGVGLDAWIWRFSRLTEDYYRLAISILRMKKREAPGG